MQSMGHMPRLDGVLLAAGLSALLSERCGGQVSIAWNHDCTGTDILRSIQIGWQAMSPCDGFFLLPGDMPAVRQETLRRLAAAWSPVWCFAPWRDAGRTFPSLASVWCRNC